MSRRCCLESGFRNRNDDGEIPHNMFLAISIAETFRDYPMYAYLNVHLHAVKYANTEIHCKHCEVSRGRVEVER
jgi:hypothetical protein